MGAHCAAYRITFGEYRRGLYVLHTCDTPLCVRPDHLWLGTQSDNMKDCVAKGRNANAYRWTKEDNPNAGKRMPDEMRERVSKWKERPFRLVDPTGRLIEGINLTQFCKTHGLNQGGMWCVLAGQKPHHKGYTKP
jgi:hypothetical protein